jgi:hypothetical protein
MSESQGTARAPIVPTTTRTCQKCGAALLAHQRSFCSVRCSARRRAGQLRRHTPESLLALGRRDGDCIVWTRGVTDCGYGRVEHEGRSFIVSRLIYELLHGPVPAILHVCHRCDNPPCFNPDHLFVGTALDNIQDSIRKGRKNQVKGERVHTAKVTAEQVVEMRRRRNAGEQWKHIAMPVQVENPK